MTLEALIDFFHGLSPQSVDRFPEFYSADAYFKDPFNEVRRVEEIQAIFARMYEQVHEPRFKVLQTVCEQDDAFLVWDMEFRFSAKSKVEVVRGVSHIRLDASGKATWHRDYWDTGEELYQKIPVLGAFFRWLRRRAR